MNGRAVQRVDRLEIVLAFLFGCLAIAAVLWLAFRSASLTERNCCGGITYKFCARVEMMSSVAD
jgi:hypothetical protein